MKTGGTNYKAPAMLASLALGIGLAIWWRQSLHGASTPAAAPSVQAAAESPPSLRELEQTELAARAAPNDPHLAVEAGRLAGDAGRSEAALHWFQRAQRLDPELLPAITGEGQMWMALGRPLRAVEAYERARKLAPEEARLLMELSRANLYLRDIQAAIRDAETARKLDPENPAVYRQLAATYTEALDERRSVESIERAVQLGPGDPENWELRATLYLRNRRPDEAEVSARKTLELDPADVEANVLLARAVIERRKNADADREAFAVLSRARMLQPHHAEALFIQGQILLRAGNLPLALSLLRQAREVDPRNPEYVRALGQALVRAGKGEEGMKILSEAQALPPYAVGFSGLENQALSSTDPQVHLRLADLYRRQQLFDCAVFVLQRAAGRLPESAALRTKLAQVREEARRASGVE